MNQPEVVYKRTVSLRDAADAEPGDSFVTVQLHSTGETGSDVVVLRSTHRELTLTDEQTVALCAALVGALDHRNEAAR